MKNPKFEMELKLYSLNNDRVLEEFQKALETARALGYQKIDLKLKAYETVETVETVVPEGQMNLFEEEAK